VRLSKKFMLIGLLTIVILGGTFGGVAIARANDQGTATGNTSQLSTLLDKVASIYQQNTGVTLDTAELSKAFTQAGNDLRSVAMDDFLNKLVEEGKITQDQADQYKTWMNSRPDVPDILSCPGLKGDLPSMMGRFGGNMMGHGNSPATGNRSSN
jgi:hypothetical protein